MYYKTSLSTARAIAEFIYENDRSSVIAQDGAGAIGHTNSNYDFSAGVLQISGDMEQTIVEEFGLNGSELAESGR